jgi:hypothetical protein
MVIGAWEDLLKRKLQVLDEGMTCAMKSDSRIECLNRHDNDPAV